jgi:hypothetical protein
MHCFVVLIRPRVHTQRVSASQLSVRAAACACLNMLLTSSAAVGDEIAWLGALDALRAQSDAMGDIITEVRCVLAMYV